MSALSRHPEAIGPTLVETRRAKPISGLPLAVRSFGLTDRGLERPSNEDQFLIGTLTRALQIRQSSLPQSNVQYAQEHGWIFVVADGMGGHRGGEQASALAVSTIEHFVVNTVTWLLSRRERDHADDLIRELKVALRRANAKVCGEAARHPELAGMGTTLTMACSFGSELFVAHAGDSRCYLARRTNLHQLTQDHTLAKELERGGLLEPEQAAQHPFRHVITNAVGGSERRLRTEVCRVRLERDDVILLCTDGLTRMLSDDRIAHVLQKRQDPQAASKELVSLANDEGGQDNVTVIVARYYEASGEARPG